MCICMYVYVCGMCMLSYNLVPPTPPPPHPHPSPPPPQKRKKILKSSQENDCVQQTWNDCKPRTWKYLSCSFTVCRGHCLSSYPIQSCWNECVYLVNPGRMGQLWSQECICTCLSSSPWRPPSLSSLPLSSSPSQSLDYVSCTATWRRNTLGRKNWWSLRTWSWSLWWTSSEVA